MTWYKAELEAAKKVAEKKLEKAGSQATVEKYTWLIGEIDKVLKTLEVN